MKKLIIFLSIFFIGINYINAKEVVEYSGCVDGDTIKVLLDGKEYTARLLAIDTPESVHTRREVEYLGKESSEYTCNRIKNASKLEIEYDENEDKMDMFDRLLVWVFADDSLIQKELIEKGYAKVGYIYGDYKYTKDLENAQEIASAKNIGIWDEDAKSKYNKDNNIKEDIEDEEIEEKTTSTTTTSVKDSDEYSTKDIIIIGILLLIIVFIGDKSIKSKAKTKLKKYLK